MLHYYKLFWLNALNIKGRSRRKEYWYPILMNFLLSIVIGLSTYLLPIPSILEEIVGWIIYILLTIAMFTATVRRFHDVGMTMLLPIIMFIGTLMDDLSELVNLNITTNLHSFVYIILIIAAVIYLVIAIVALVICCTNGQQEVNKYGRNPKNS
ncbi:DUF805 domain-containing protein [Staphylococcus edaphicus]|uniref:DUF805 domain-containing protein n=1 Tax=Staphylococcus edaphicus TaxID=1955013 RepID=A0A2C6U3R4_9STAP|nr:DUF805 domain-containing protein [Staphylococcus edaphicus]PHK48522.1 DUF805 domain-containing protein [Staphylococcus edaphicus]UQW81474.1 DUF805 domain-containing protein [Staphylococcus edaphicus]